MIVFYFLEMGRIKVIRNTKLEMGYNFLLGIKNCNILRNTGFHSRKLLENS